MIRPVVILFILFPTGLVGCGGAVDTPSSLEPTASSPSKSPPSNDTPNPSAPSKRSPPIVRGDLESGWVGTIAGTSQSGTLHMNVALDGAATGTARLSPGGVVALSGTFVSSKLTLSSSDGTYQFEGVLRKNERFGLGGIYRGPVQGTGGSFTLLSSYESTPTIFCGTFSGATSGVWNFASTTTDITGAASYGGESLELHGTRSNGGTISIPIGPWGQGAAASGTITGSTASGTWSDGDKGGSGTWVGAADACP